MQYRTSMYCMLGYIIIINFLKWFIRSFKNIKDFIMVYWSFKKFDDGDGLPNIVFWSYIIVNNVVFLFFCVLNC